MSIKWQSLLDAQRFKLKDSWLIFFACLLVYSWSAKGIVNYQALASPDSIPNSLLAFNWLFNGRLDFDNFRQGIYYNGGLPPYFFWESKSAHLVSVYPIGPAIVSFPIYVCFALLLWISHGFQSIEITSAAFSDTRLLLERFAAAIIASFAVALFYQLSRLKFERSVALISAFIYAFATHHWVINSQALWQHGSTNLVLIAVMLCFFKANRDPTTKSLLLLNAGILGGLMLGIRPTNLVFLLSIVVYAIALYRRQAFFTVLGLSSALISIAWNLYYFKSFTGGYGTFSNLFTLTFEQFIAGFTGLLFSPSRGLFVYSPILILAIPGFIQIFRRWKQKDEKLLILLFLSCIPLLLQYCFFRMWWAGASYGYRFLTDLLPILCFSVNYAIADALSRRKLLNLKILIVSGLLTFSVFVQVVGVFGACFWDGIPTVIEYDPFSSKLTDAEGKLWQHPDSQIERHAHSLMFRITHPTRQPNYTSGLAGQILQLRDAEKNPLPDTLSIPVGGKIRVRAIVQNTGTSRWFGYQTGASHLGEARVRVLFTDILKQNVLEYRLFISGQPRRGKTAEAIGDITFPSKPGTYTLRFSLIAEGVSEMPTHLPQSTQAIEATVTSIDQRY
ncbi:MAG: glycosyltransferase family 39 protein [Leptolyngbya sp. UWPOB_LEPTO1]|uniref:glycosyltransferase family 39 protein n=1 Tax=Leptolyngbya sp. UWPOB_LEPTO1 TaxID=2815653 RepID=UPI001AC72467|nr:glycosyltransferase family 39 protein [Leptolyngbya sp. UWPOB_LEPTO1]MBN8560516.1 glycosyltransferase family 39 protein [Leptolyngbya sp. UWPOB_LEPTO1]